MEDLIGSVPTEYIIWTVIVLLLIGGVLYKVIPPIVNTFKFIKNSIDRYESLFKLSEKNNDDIKKINEFIKKSGDTNEQIVEVLKAHQQFIEGTVEEREITLRSLLGVVKGLQEIGANGPTKVAEAEIQEYLLKKASQVPSPIMKEI